VPEPDRRRTWWPDGLTAAVALAWQAARGMLLSRVACAVLAGVIPVAAAWCTKLLLDMLGARPQPETADLLPVVLALIATGLAAAVLPQVAEYLDAEIGRAVETTGRRRLYRAVGDLDGLSRLEDPQFHDRLELAAAGGPAAPAQVVGAALAMGQGTVTVVGMLAALLTLSPVMAAVVAVAAVPTLRAELALGRQRARMMWQLGQSGRREMFYADLLSSVTAAKEVRLYGLGDLFGTRMIDELRAINRGNSRLDRRELRVQAVLGSLGAVVAGGGLLWAAFAAWQGRLGIGDVSVFVAAVAGVQGAVGTLVTSIGRAQRALSVFGHLRYVLAVGPDLSPPVGQALTAVPPLRTGIELRDVWFRYDPALPWVLRGVNLTLPVGRATALVGLNGAGKSTLVKLLCRFYDPTRGAVLWDGVDLRDLPVAEVRRRLGVVFQDFMQYDLTVAENIGVGDVDVFDDRAAVQAAADRAGCRDVVDKLPAGFDTLLTRTFAGEVDRADPSTGVVLSGGQWQRVALARALMRDRCDLLILDEPSAGLDAEAEYEVHRRLRAHRQDRTSLLISHRMNTIREADEIAVLADGVVVERGDHRQLMAADGPYRRLFGLQAAGYRDADPPELRPPTGGRPSHTERDQPCA
jgi:ATP-binding cassette subfamily B protein